MKEELQAAGQRLLPTLSEEDLMRDYLIALLFWNGALATIGGLLYGLHLIGPYVMVGAIAFFIVFGIPIFMSQDWE